MLGGKGEWAAVAWQPAVWVATQPNLCAVSRGGGGGGGGVGGKGGGEPWRAWRVAAKAKSSSGPVSARRHPVA